MATGADDPQADSAEARFLAQLDLIERVISFVCARHHLTTEDMEDFGSHVKLKFVENDYAVLSKFQGRSSLRTYLTVVIQRLFLDYRNHSWGKWRPSAEARRAGAVGILLERLLTRDGHTFEEACELMNANHHVSTSRGDLERLAARLPNRPRRRFEPEDALVNVPASGRPADDVAIDRLRLETAARISDTLKMAMSRLDVQDRLILRLRFEDSRTVAEIAAMLRLDQKGLYRRLDRLTRDLRTQLAADGISEADVSDILERVDIDVEWEGEAAGNAAMAGLSRPAGARK